MLSGYKNNEILTATTFADKDPRKLPVANILLRDVEIEVDSLMRKTIAVVANFREITSRALVAIAAFWDVFLANVVNLDWESVCLDMNESASVAKA